MSNGDCLMRAKRLRSAWFMLLLLIPAVAGCTRARARDEPASITFAYDGSEEYYEALVEAFNEIYPHITVELDTSSDEGDPDVFILSPFDLTELLEEEAVLAMDPLIEQDESFDLSDFYPGVAELCSREGRLWAIPSEANMLVMYYNKDLFDAYNVSYPEVGWTWDDFLAKALALRDESADIFGYATVDEFLEPLPFIYQHGGQILDDLHNPTRTTFDDPLNIEAMEWYAALIHEHDVAPSQRQYYDLGGGVETGVYQGQVGMWISWLSERGGGGGVEETWPAEWKFRWGMVPLPRDAQAATPMFVLGYAISSQAASPEACWRWVTFLSGQMQTPYGMTPARRSLAESDAYSQLVGSDVAAVARKSIEDAMLLSPALVEFVPPNIYGMAVFRIISGYTTPQEALTDAQRRAQE